jgi:periplasmic divalent cation tolerance protein
VTHNKIKLLAVSHQLSARNKIKFMNSILIVSTADTLKLAEEIASALVENHEAACVNIVPGIRSVYRWEGKMTEDEEVLLLIKSVKEKFEAIRYRIRSIHTYQIPEVIALPITDGDANYLNWLRKQLSADS